MRVAPSAWRRAAEFCKDELGCDYLSFVAGARLDADAGRCRGRLGRHVRAGAAQGDDVRLAGSAGRFQVFAHVESTRVQALGVTLKTDVDADSPHAESWVSVYPGADWHERETWEMYGIVFDGHPSLRHLYLPSEFEGHPLRKDFPLLAREVKPWPGLVDVEPMPGEPRPKSRRSRPRTRQVNRTAKDGVGGDA